jgi:acyl-coenzyme A thioesterase PaaI-like protein
MMAGSPPEAETATPESLVAAGWQPFSTPGFHEVVGQLYTKECGDSIHFGFIADLVHKNRRDVLHGGYLAAFADRTLALTGRRVNDGMPQATIELSLRFIDAVRIGEFVVCVPEVVRKTRSLIFVRGTLLVGSRVVATADGIWKILGSRQK